MNMRLMIKIEQEKENPDVSDDFLGNIHFRSGANGR